MNTCLRCMAAIALTAISSACSTDSTADESRRSAVPPPAQWINYPTPGLPRNADGTPNLTAPAPRTADGKPDFSGVYGFGGGGGGRGRGAGAGAAPAGPQLKPGAEKYRVQRGPQDLGRTADCMPLIPPDAFGVPYEFQIIQNKDHLVIIHEYPGTFRIVPLDGEPHQVDPDPAWLGDSVGKWEGDTLVIDTIGYNEKTEIAGYRHTDALHTVERLRRVEGGFDYEITIEDPNVFVAPFTQTRSFRLTAAPMGSDEVPSRDRSRGISRTRATTCACSAITGGANRSTTSR